MKGFVFLTCLISTLEFLSTPVLSQTSKTIAAPATILAEKTDEQLKAEVAALQAELKRRRAKSKVSSAKPNNPAAAQVSAPADFTPAELEKKHADLAQQFYLRSDPLDAFYYLYPAAPLDGKGASISYTDDIANKSQVVNTQAFASWVVARQYFGGSNVEAPQGLPELSAAAYAPYIMTNGKLTEPRNASERSALQLGLDSQYEFWGGGLFSLQNAGVRPYFQSDFRGIGRIEGAEFLWEPYKENINLGARYDVMAPKLVGFLWRVIGQGDVSHVDKAGLSDYVSGRTYSWLGGTVQTRMIFFENYNLVPDLLCGRIYANGSYKYFWDANSRQSVNDIEAELGYNLSDKPTPSTIGCRGSTSGTTSLGKTSISIVYNKGTDRDTLEKREQYKLQLNYQY
jgi:ribosomal protein L29